MHSKTCSFVRVQVMHGYSIPGPSNVEFSYIRWKWFDNNIPTMHNNDTFLKNSFLSHFKFGFEQSPEVILSGVLSDDDEDQD